MHLDDVHVADSVRRQRVCERSCSRELLRLYRHLGALPHVDMQRTFGDTATSLWRDPIL